MRVRHQLQGSGDTLCGVRLAAGNGGGSNCKRCLRVAATAVEGAAGRDAETVAETPREIVTEGVAETPREIVAVRTQRELEEAISRSTPLIIRIDSDSEQWMHVWGSGVHDLYACGHSMVQVHLDARITVTEWATVVAWDAVAVTAIGGYVEGRNRATVHGSLDARVELYDDAYAEMRDRTRVTLDGRATADVYDDVCYTASTSARVTVRDRATGTAYDDAVAMRGDSRYGHAPSADHQAVIRVMIDAYCASTEMSAWQLMAQTLAYARGCSEQMAHELLSEECQRRAARD